LVFVIIKEDVEIGIVAECDNGPLRTCGDTIWRRGGSAIIGGGFRRHDDRGSQAGSAGGAEDCPVLSAGDSLARIRLAADWLAARLLAAGPPTT